MRTQNGNVIVSKKLLPLLTEQVQVKIPEGVFTVDPRIGILSRLGPDVSLNVPTNGYNFFCFNKQNKITYWDIKKGDQPLTEDGKWKKEGRQEMKPGRFFLYFSPYFRVYDNNFSCVPNNDTVVGKVLARAAELFVARIKGENEDIEFKISEDPYDIYITNCDETSYNLCNSCMRPNSAHDCRLYAEFYNYIPELKIVYKKNNYGGLVFRALLWKAKIFGTDKEITFLDRVYGTESIVDRMIGIAKENGWYYRYFSSDRIWNDDTRISLALEVPLPIKAIDYLETVGSPYIDTLSYVYRKRNKKEYFLSNIYENDFPNEENGEDVEYLAEIQSSCGTTHTIYIRCRYCGKKDKEGEEFEQIHHDEYICKECFERERRSCFFCKTILLKQQMNEIHLLHCEEGEQNASFYTCISCYQRKGIHMCSACGKSFLEMDMSYSDYYENWFCDHCREQWQECPVCHTSYSPSDFHRNIRIDGVLFEKVCRQCVRESVTRCSCCGRRCSGVLPFEVGNFFYSSPIDYFCMHCREQAKPVPSIMDLSITLNRGCLQGQFVIDFIDG